MLAAELIQGAIFTALREKERCSVMLTGGQSARRLYGAWANFPALRKMSHVHFYFGDERCVPPRDAESNYGMVMRTLFFQGIPKGCQVFRMEAEDPDRDAAAARYSESLPNAMDLMLLGVGEDGHIASIFPGSPVFQEVNRRVVPVTAPKLACERLTITPLVIAQARSIFVLATGAAKAKVLTRALKQPNDVTSLPARLVLRANWLMDRA